MAEPYVERVTWPGWFFLLLLCGFGLGVWAVVGTVARDGWHWAAFFLGFPVSLVAYIFWRVRYVDLSFGSDEVAYGYCGLKNRIPRERIHSCAPEEYRVSRYMGWGYRFGWKARDRAYSFLGYRRGVRLEFDDERGERWSVFLSCHDPESAVRALKA